MCHGDIKTIMKNYESTREKINKNGYNLEYYQNDFSDAGHRASIMKEFYRIILERCKNNRYKHKEIIDFLIKFNQFFTTNYDPLLYRFLLQIKEDGDIEKDEFYRDLERIHEGYITNLELCEDIPLRNIPQKTGI